MRLIRPNFHDVINRAKVLGVYIARCTSNTHAYTYDIPPLRIFPRQIHKNTKYKNVTYIHILQNYIQFDDLTLKIIPVQWE
jgi:hypothetical protein